MTRSRRARREAARERQPDHDRNAPQPADLVEASEEPTRSRVRSRKQARTSTASGAAWYRDARLQQLVFIVVAAVLVGGFAYFLYDTQQRSVAPKPLPPLVAGATVVAPPAGTPGLPTPDAGSRKTYAAPFPMSIDLDKKYTATIETSRGRIVFEMNPRNSPATVNNFVSLAREGFYDGLVFHRVETWVIQGGDPRGTGTGDAGYKFPDEPVIGDYTPGAVAMANSGPNTNGSQFFIMKTQTQPLPKQYNLFGRVIEGQNVVDTITRNDRMDKVTITEG